MDNTVIEKDGVMVCSCGAREGKSRKRFQQRHPKLCSVRKAYTHQLAGGVRSVEEPVKRALNSTSGPCISYIDPGYLSLLVREDGVDAPEPDDY